MSLIYEQTVKENMYTKKSEINLQENPELTMGDIGERKIIQRIAEKLKKINSDSAHLLHGIGDDCAVLCIPNDQFIVTTIDACPTPVICMLEELNYWYFGWYAMIISLSDIASMGAEPKGMLLSVEAPDSMKLVDFDLYYQGIIDAACEFNCPVIGGNIKDANKFSCTSTAMGYVDQNKMLQRNAAEPGDKIVVLGDMGLFWAGVILKLLDLPVSLSEAEYECLMKNLKKPIPRIQEGKALLENNISKCAMDCSDGLIACFYEIAEAGNNIDLNIDLSEVITEDVLVKIAASSGIDINKLLLTWGNWQIVCTVKEERLHILRKVMSKLNCPVSLVGEVSHGTGKTWYCENGRKGILNYVASERFTKNSFFTHGLEAYLDSLRNEPLIKV